MADLDLERRRRDRGGYRAPLTTVDDINEEVDYTFTYNPDGTIATMVKVKVLDGETVTKTYTFSYTGDQLTGINQESVSS